MNKLDAYYRGFREYRQETQDNIDCKKERIALNESNQDQDILNSIKYRCTISTDWIEAIEKGLEFVEKAVAEERQFIRVNGEVIPIEKVKKVSKSSVEHLARHSNMITHLPEDENEEDFIPDNLYITEKLSDYAVYENRFLYLLLCYLRDFINLRLDQIDRLRMTYVGNMFFHKQITTKKRDFYFETRLYDKRIDNPYPLKDNDSEYALKRIRDLEQMVNSLLNTNLMVEVSKAPMIKPPITKTNVLKMNNNFKNSLALYDYIVSYKGLGFTYEEVKRDFVPLKENMASELMDSFALSSFLSYKIGNEIEDTLLTSYKEEEKRREQEEAAKMDARIARLKKKAKEDGKSLEEYMVLLEMKNASLQKEIEQINELKVEILNLNKKIDELNLEKLDLKHRIDDLLNDIEAKLEEIARLNQKYIDDMAKVQKDHELEIDSIMNSHRQEIEQVRNECDDLIYQKEQELAERRDDISAEYENKIIQINKNHKNEIESLQYQLSSLNNEIDQTKEERNQKVASLETQIKETTAHYEDIVKDVEGKNVDLKNQNDLFLGELNARRASEGRLVPTLEYTSRERFLELEDQYNAFNRYFEEQWKLTKKQIRKEALQIKKPEKKVKTPKVTKAPKEIKAQEAEVKETSQTEVNEPSEENKE